MLALGGDAFSYERGTTVGPAPLSPAGTNTAASQQRKTLRVVEDMDEAWIYTLLSCLVLYPR